MCLSLPGVVIKCLLFPFLIQAAVEVFVLVQELLPAVSALNQKYAPPTFNPNQSTDSTTGNQPEQGLSACTTSNHYSVIESDHPYKQAGVTQYRVRYSLACYLLSKEMTPEKLRDTNITLCKRTAFCLTSLRFHFLNASAGPPSSLIHSVALHSQRMSYASSSPAVPSTFPAWWANLWSMIPSTPGLNSRSFRAPQAGQPLS